MNIIKIIIATLLLTLPVIRSKAQWVQLPQFPALNSASQIKFVDKNIGWMNYTSRESNNIYQTVDGGKNWNENLPYGNGFGTQISMLCFKNKNEGIVSFGRGAAPDYYYVNRYTVDGGNSWKDLIMVDTAYQGKDQPRLLSLDFVDGVYLGFADMGEQIPVRMVKIESDKVYVLNEVKDYPSKSVMFIDSLVGYADFPFAGLKKTINGGKTWNTLRTGVSFGISSIYFTDKSNGVIIADNTILLTANGGLSWKNVSLPNNKLAFTDVKFATPKVGYICGRQGIILKTVDGGLNWREMDSGTFENLYSLSFVDSTLGYCAGDNGTLLKLLEDPTVPQVTQISVPNDTWCAGGNYKISYFVNKKFNSSNTFTAYLSDGQGTFSNSVAIGKVSSDTSGTIEVTVPANTALNFGYRIRIQSDSPVGTSATGKKFIEIQPSERLGINVTLDKYKVCEGDKVTASTFVVAGGSSPKVSWYNNKQLIGQGLKFTFAPKDKDLIYTSVKSSLACSTPDSVIFAYPIQCTKDPLPEVVIPEALYVQIKTPTIPTVTVQGNILMSSSPTGNQWYKSGSAITSATAQTYTTTENGVYSVSSNDGVCPTQFSSEVNVIMNSSENGSEISYKFELYPNPANSSLNIQTTMQVVKLTVYQYNGIKILESEVPEKLDISTLSQGLYLLEAIDSNDRRILKKFEKR